TVVSDKLKDSIVAANDKGKIKIKKVDDYTTDKVEIVVTLPANVSPDQTIDALYAFTDCQISFSPQTCVIVDNKPVFMTASDILRHSTFRTKDLLRQELEILLHELEDRWHWVSLEKIFFEKRIYKQLEKDSPTWEDQLAAIEKAFDPYRKLFKKEITRDDVLKLCEKPVRKISKFDIKKAEEELAGIDMDIEETKNHLAHLTEYAINYFRHILEKFGKGRERKTEIRNFEDIEASVVALSNEKLYVNYATGFAGYNLKREEGVEQACECSKMDDIIVFRKDGTFIVTRVQDKAFVGSADCKEIVHVGVFRKADERTVYNMIYRDGPLGIYYVKRFFVKSVIRDKEYSLTQEAKGSKVVHFTANPNGEAEVITIHHTSNPKLRKVSFDFDFSTLAIKGKEAKGNIITKNAIRSISTKEAGVSTLGACKRWYEESVNRINDKEMGLYLGEFKGKDKILTLTKSGCFKTYNFDISNHFDDDLVAIRKWNAKTIVTAVYREGENQSIYVKRFVVEDFDRKLSFLDDAAGDTLLTFAFDTRPRLRVVYPDDTSKKIASEIIEIEEFIGVKG
ncbi:MAG: DNA gyrase/topoisomerase IV subunit A, partial [Bacteroidales bacterium]|nr:DNA gyrase/topoisomerase IV subunit A [Bacteroidales bacterium]